jgi:hypothetical protein
LSNPFFSYVLGFESLVGNREIAAEWFERKHPKTLARESEGFIPVPEASALKKGRDATTASRRLEIDKPHSTRRPGI